MNAIGSMLNVIMDGIKDTDMLIGYAKESMKAGKNTEYEWFKDHAIDRFDRIVEDFDFIKSHINLPEKVRSGDAVSEALHEYIEYQVREIRAKIETL